MNRVLFRAEELDADGRLTLRDVRATHLETVLGAACGDRLRLGMLDGDIGVGEVEQAEPGRFVLRWISEGPPPPVPDIDLLLALPRPLVMKRLWAPLASLGVRRILLTNAARVEPNYFATHWLRPEIFEPLLIEGLQQSGGTQRPVVEIHRRFRVLVEGSLGDAPACRLLAHPEPAPTPVPSPAPGAGLLLAVGPEGGWNDFELDLLERQGFRRFSLGWQTLRTDTACIALLAVLQHSLAVAAPAP